MQARGASRDMAGQLTLFPATAEAPQGLQYFPDFVSANAEQELIAHIRDLPLTPFQFGAFEGKRRVASFGWRYNYTDHRIEKAEEIPPWVFPLAEKIETLDALPAGSVRQVLCTEYDVGVGIGWHRDKPQFDKIFGLSLGVACKFRFRRKSGDKWQRFTIEPQPRSLYGMSGESRRIWEHSIPPVEAPRYSITFRTMPGA
jgi:alkylated DNA repair dioxygenase AlkB